MHLRTDWLWFVCVKEDVFIGNVESIVYVKSVDLRDKGRLVGLACPSIFKYHITDTRLVAFKNEFGIFEISISGVKIFDNYKYAITNGESTVLKADPFARHFETPPGTCSKVYYDSYKWNDSKWREEKKTKNI